MTHENEHDDLIDLGTASEDTLGNSQFGTPEPSHYYVNALSDE